MRTPISSIFAILLVGISISPISAQQGQDTVIAVDTVWGSEIKVIPHDLIVLPPATLQLEGTRLLIGNRVLVERGAQLVVHPGNGQAADIGPVSAGPASDTNGLWMQINGTFIVSGTPRAEIHGLRGTGVHDLYSGAGSIRIFGTANIQGIHLFQSNGTLLVLSGSATVENSLIENTGFFGLATHGKLWIRNSTIEHNSFGILCHDPGSVNITNSNIQSATQALLDNGCPVQINNSNMAGNVTAIYLTAAATLNLTDVHINGFSQRGIFSQNLPGASGQDYSPTLNLRRVAVQASRPAAVGIYLQKTTTDIRDSLITQNSNGILASDSFLSIQNSTIENNVAYGIRALRSRYASNLLIGNHFGDWRQGTANGYSAVSARILVRAQVTDEYNRSLGGVKLQVFQIGNSTPIATIASTPNGTGAEGEIQLYHRNSDGTSVFLGPFNYILSQADLPAPIRGSLDLKNPVIMAFSKSRQSSAFGVDWSQMGSLYLLAIAAIMVGIGLAWTPLKKIAGRQKNRFR